MAHSITLQNDFWQVGILPETGASIAFGRVKRGAWLDVLRPTEPVDYNNSSNCSSFIMMPWCNRIRDGVLVFEDERYQLRTSKDDGTARHGDVRSRKWTIVRASRTAIMMEFDSRRAENVNFPFAFTAVAEYALEGHDFLWRLSMTNQDTRRFPAGFGHHPYFVRTPDQPRQWAESPLLHIDCAEEFPLTDAMATGAPQPISPDVDFRHERLVGDAQLNHLLTGRSNQPEVARLRYPQAGVEIEMQADGVFKHIVLYTLEDRPFVAVEPMTNANDGFNLLAQGIEGSGVFVLEPGETVRGEVRLNFSAVEEV
jgi:aldose 1-epimerase